MRRRPKPRLRPSERRSEWYRTVRDRFAERMQEITQDTRDYVRVREAEEREQLVAGYDNLLGSLEELGLLSAISLIDSKASGALSRCGVPSHIRFRLADLYFEVASEISTASDAYYEALAPTI